MDHLFTMKNNPEIDRLRYKESEYVKRLHQIVSDTINEEELILHNLVNPPLEPESSAQRLSDKIARFGGSWAFILSFCVILMMWIIYNSLALVGQHFDPYPFILMNLILSCIAALQAPIIMMSQNRQEEKDRKRNENDYLINLKAEMQIRSLHQKMDLLLEDQIKTLFDSQAKQFKLLQDIHNKINNNTNG